MIRKIKAKHRKHLFSFLYLGYYAFSMIIDLFKHMTNSIHAFATMNHPAISSSPLTKNRMSEAISIFDVGRSMFDVHSLLKTAAPMKPHG